MLLHTRLLDLLIRALAENTASTSQQRRASERTDPLRLLLRATSHATKETSTLRLCVLLSRLTETSKQALALSFLILLVLLTHIAKNTRRLLR